MKTDIKAIQKQMTQIKKSKRANARKEVKLLNKQLDFIVRVYKGKLTEESKKNG